ncbi:epsilon-sarcoglycan isoform X2 [Venturia canescens]|uniref:epsilon-sarcoglycan isoform X2 n=1 Tax=Venturia canescens TaxID=32260 RepID=UPI001C9C847A|nr:epsilon-sarcoglycan isoform X2 [Venturia canescens]
MYSSVLLLGLFTAFASSEIIQVSEVFVIPVGPDLFDWSVDSKRAEYSYQASLLNAPDLPSWIHYTYSKRHRQGFLYGVAPKGQQDFQLEIVGLNKQTYETAYKVLDMSVRDRENITKYEVQVKIDNLNVEDAFDRRRLERLLDVFRNVLWVEAKDIYLTFLASAVEFGARLPLDPEEPEGVVIRLGSTVPFSNDLNEFQEEIKPLWRRSPCPRDFKKTTRERVFREAGFLLDWCLFHLIEDNQSPYQESARRGPSMNVISRPSSVISEHSEWRWARPNKADIPTRSYMKEIATTVFIPAALLLMLAGLLSTGLCLHHEKMKDPESELYFYELFNIFRAETRESQKREPSPVEGVSNNGVQMVQYATSERGTLRSLSAKPPSPSNSLLRSPRATDDRCNPYIRPNPPPYTGPSNITGLRVNF